MTKKEIAEAVNKLKFKITKEILLRNKIIVNWSLKIPFNKKQITTGKAKASTKIRSCEDKEEAVKSVEPFVKNILSHNPKKFKQIIEGNERE